LSRPFIMRPVLLGISLLGRWVNTVGCAGMKGWWVLSVVLVTLTLVLLVLAWIEAMPFALQAVSVVLAALGAIALIYFMLGRR
jgi:hypothetical protein